MSDITVPGNLAPYSIAVIMERTRSNDRWASERWEVRGVVQDTSPPGSTEQVIVSDEQLTQILFPGFTLKLHPDEAEGYLYNITSPHPKVFVLWRVNNGNARPERLTVSYHEGSRWMDAEDCVHGVAIPADLLPWIEAYARHHYRPEEPRKKRYASSRDKGVASHRDGVS